MPAEHKHSWIDSYFGPSKTFPGTKDIDIKECRCHRLRIEVITRSSGRAVVGYMRTKEVRGDLDSQ